MPYHYTEARAVVRSRQGPWRWWLDLGASQASAQIHTSKAAHSLLLPADQDGMGIQVRVARQRGPALWACAAGATSRSGRGRARCNDAPAGTTDSRFGSQYLGIGWRTARAAREYNAELARFQAHVSLRALVRPPADLSPVPGTTVRAQAEARTCTTMARLGMRQAMGHGWQVGAGLLHLRGSARYGAGYQSFGLWGLLPLTDHTSGSHYPGFRLWVLGLGVQRETAASRVALAAAQGFGQAHPQRQAGQAGAGPEQGRTRGGRVIVFSMTRRWQ